MSKHETPPFRMIVQRGKLVPATAYDAERLDTWRNGAEVNVRFVEDRSRWGIRKWYAVINRAVKECSTPWKTAKEASEAIKLALGIVNLTKTVGGEFLAYPKSLTELDDPELEDAVEQMLAVIYRVTGVEPDEWRKQIAGIGEQEHENPADALPAGGSDGNPATQTPPVAADPSASSESQNPDDAAPEAGDIGAQAEPGASPTSEPDMVNSAKPMATDALKAEMVKKLLQLAGDQALTPQERLETLDGMRQVWIDKMPGFPGIVSQAFATAAKIVKGELKADAGRKFMENLL